MSFFSWLRKRIVPVPRRRSRGFRPQLEALEDRCVPSAGFLDPTFDGDGVVTTNLTTITVGFQEYAHAVAVYPAGVANAGKLVVGGGAVTRSHGDLNFALVRYNPDGSLDPTFGSGGIVQKALSTSENQVMSVALVGDKILAGGYAAGNSGPSWDFALARFNADGSLDQTFGSKGKVLTDFGTSFDLGTSMVVQADGKIIVAGRSNSTSPFSNYTRFAVARYNPNGTLDATFGNKGRILVDAGESLEGGTDRFMDLALSGDQIVLVGSASSTRNIYVVRLNANGQLDPTFGTGGVAQPGQGRYTRLARQSDGKLVVSSDINYPSFSMNVTRLLTNGTTDTTFGTGGTVSLPWSTVGTEIDATALTVDPLSRIVIGGWQRNDYGSSVGKLFVARFTPDGAFDQTYGVGGFNTSGSTVNLYTYENAFVGLTLQPDGKAILVGTTNEVDQKFAVARFDGDPPLLAASLPERAIPASVTSDQVQPLLAEALARWQAAGVDISSLSGIDVRIADLGGTTLGLASGNTIWLDDNAAGWGWFIDSTPADDSEFTTPGNQGEQNRIDLLTVLEHELGHLLGFDHTDGGLMSPLLTAGVRETPTAVLDQVFADL